jgi:hypothetical protein
MPHNIEKELISMLTINGIGDKLINVIGVNVYAFYKNYILESTLNYQILNYKFGSTNEYSIDLFDFGNLVVNDKNYTTPKMVHNPDPIVSITPYIVYKTLNEENVHVTFEDVSNKFLEIAKNIKPSNIIKKYIPKGIENAYGIHLRLSDKVKAQRDIRHETSPNEFTTLVNILLNNILEIIHLEENPIFFLTSEDATWIEKIKTNILDISAQLKKNVIILDVDCISDSDKSIKGFTAILDLFCLSKCKTIIQSLRYSAFSVVSALIGNEKIINNSKFLDTDDLCIIYLWNSVIKINNANNFDKDKYQLLIDKYVSLNVFYGGFYIK